MATNNSKQTLQKRFSEFLRIWKEDKDHDKQWIHNEATYFLKKGWIGPNFPLPEGSLIHVIHVASVVPVASAEPMASAEPVAPVEHVEPAEPVEPVAPVVSVVSKPCKNGFECRGKNGKCPFKHPEKKECKNGFACHGRKTADETFRRLNNEFLVGFLIPSETSQGLPR